MNKLLRKPKVQYMGNIGHKRQTQIAKMMSNTDPTKVPEMNTGVHEFMVTFSRNIFSKSIFKDCCRKKMTLCYKAIFIHIYCLDQCSQIVAISYVRSSPKCEFLETIFSTLFKTTFFVQIMVRKPVTNTSLQQSFWILSSLTF